MLGGTAPRSTPVSGPACAPRDRVDALTAGRPRRRRIWPGARRCLRNPGAGRQGRPAPTRLAFTRLAPTGLLSPDFSSAAWSSLGFVFATAGGFQHHQLGAGGDLFAAFTSSFFTVPRPGWGFPGRLVGFQHQDGLLRFHGVAFAHRQINDFRFVDVAQVRGGDGFAGAAAVSCPAPSPVSCILFALFVLSGILFAILGIGSLRGQAAPTAVAGFGVQLQQGSPS